MKQNCPTVLRETLSRPDQRTALYTTMNLLWERPPFDVYSVCFGIVNVFEII